jgi:NAD(P)-dependent dehydrogenase (short-subunit alcohol dehydrogenase family)
MFGSFGVLQRVRRLLEPRGSGARTVVVSSADSGHSKKGTALVTGAGGGIGRAIALRLARDGRDVAVLDLDLAGANLTASQVRALGRRAIAVQADVAQRSAVRDALALAQAALGDIDLLVNNAGILKTAPFLEVSEADWRQILAVNLDGVFHGCQAVLPGMLARGAGCIVNMSSWVGKKGVPNHAAYSASKAAVIALTQSLAGEIAGRGVRVNAVCPGLVVETQMRAEAEALSKAQGLPDVHTRVQTLVPMRRAGVPDDIAGVVAFLASADAAYMTGQAINITGGLWMN